MDLMGEVINWFGDSEQWAGPNAIPRRLFEHIQLTVVSMSLALVPALALGLYIGHRRRFEFAVVTVANLGRALPSFAILALAFPISLELGLGLGFWPAVVALFFLAIPPMLTNTYVGVKEVEADTVEAARGMGMSGGEILRRIEVPLAAPLMVTGIRTSAVQVVATATLAALVAGGGLGRYIVDGFATGDKPQVLGGAVLVAALAILTEVLFAVIERIVRPATKGPEERQERGYRELSQIPRPPDVPPIGGY
jgi:osmoprotectant transport system permease protein